MNGSTIIAKAKSHLGESGTPTWNAYKNASGQAWCCQFVWRVFNECGASKLFYGGSKTAYCPTARTWCKNNLTKVSVSSAKAGDIIFFDWNRNGVPDHIGFVDYVDGSTVHTIEGNTGSPAKVMARTRSAYIQDIWRPKYEAVKPIPKPSGKYKGEIAKPTLKNGSKGEEVKHLQSFLNWYGAWSLKVDGELGRLTADKLEVFQASEGLVVDAVYGKLSFAKAETYKEVEPEKYSGEFPDLKNIIAMEAIRCAWKYGTKTSVYTYPKGKKTSEYASAMKKAYPNGLSGRTSAAKAGAACDVFVGAVMRTCGFDQSFPSGLYKDTNYLKNSSKFKKVSVTSYKDLRDGDVVHWINKTKSGHVLIAVKVDGNCYQANGHAATKRYGVLDNKNRSYKPSSYKSFAVYRPVNPAAGNLRKGDYGSEVTKLQKFLKWAGFDCGSADGDFGDRTLGAVKNFQLKAGLTSDGEFGSKSLAKAKEYKR